MKANFPEEDRDSVQAAAAAARVVSVTESEEGSGPTQRTEGELDPQVAFGVMNFRNALSGAESDGLCFSHLQSIIRTQFGRQHFGAGIEAFWRTMADETEAFPPEFWELLAVKPHGPGGKRPPGLCGDDLEAS